MSKSITEVAKDLNLAPSTISKVVNNNGRVGTETRKRVLEYVKEVGYVANSSARILKSKKSSTIGVVYSDISQVGFEHPFFSRIFQSFKTHVEQAGYEIVMIIHKLGTSEQSYLQWSMNKKIDGILIVVGNINNPNIIEVVNSDLPCVSTDIIMPNLHSVISDDYQGVSLSIKYAISKNLTKIYVISGPNTARSFSERVEAFRMEMKINKLSFDEENLIISTGFSDEDGYQSALKLLKNKNLPELVLVFSDVIAFGVIRCFESNGFHVPNDIEVIGFDDIQFSKYFTPSLSTIRQETQQIGTVAANELLKEIENGKEKKQTITRIPVSIVHRDTTNKIK
jgi:DNA-binding LacI/PurR family transcriptional regulator